MLKKMKDIYDKNGGNYVGIMEVDKDQTSNYGIIDTANKNEDLVKITSMIEKPSKETAPSNLAIIGRYILQPEIFALLEKASPGVGGEIQITDSMNKLLETDNFHGVKFTGKRFDCGRPMGFLEANIAYAAENDAGELKEMLKKYI
jgi:UTP--glucose-1-phosphate uridylyltransferase